MAICVAVDANILLSALLGGKPSSILFDARYTFVSTEFTLSEVRKYIPRLSKKLQLDEKILLTMLDMLPIVSYPQSSYRATLAKAQKMISARDPKDSDILALAFILDAYLWSQDKDFETCGYTKVLKTYQFIE